MSSKSISLCVGALVATLAAARTGDPVRAALETALQRAETRASFDVVQRLEFGRAGGEATWIAENGAHGLRASFRADGVALAVSTADGEQEQLALTLVSWGRPGAQRAASAPRIAASGDSIELDRGDLVEWYHNGPSGLEQGFALLEAPPSDGESTGVELRMSVAGTLAARAESDGAFFVHDACARASLSYSGLRAWDATGRVLDARMVAAGEWLSILVDDAGARYPLTIDPLIAAFDAKLVPNIGSGNQGSGNRVTVDGDTAVVVGSGTSFYGSVEVAHVFVHATGGWTEQARLDGEATIETFGDVAISGDLLVFGDNPLSSSLGCWYVYERTGTTWNYVLAGCEGNIETTIGLSIAANHPRFAITDDLGGNGVTKIYSKATGAWVVEGGFGTGGSVALRDDLFVMSTDPAPYSINPQIRVYRRSGTSWSLIATPLTFTGSGTPQVAIDEEHNIAVGDPGDDTAGNNAGAVYLLRPQGSSWVLWQKILSPEFPDSAGFGGRIALGGGTLAVGSEGNDGAGINAGAVYLFRRNGGWTQMQELVASDAAGSDRFGTDVALSGSRLLVGSPGDDDLSANRGSGYVFTIARDIEVYCTAKVNSLGCLPAIDYAGTPSASSASPFLISARQVLNNKIGVSFYGVGGRAAVPFQGGTRCVATPVRRTGTQTSGGNVGLDDCSGVYSLDFNARIQSGVDPNLVPGVQVDLQFWSRDSAVPSGTGLSDAIEFRIGA